MLNISDNMGLVYIHSSHLPSSPRGWFVPWIGHDIPVGHTGDGEPGSGALHPEPPAVEVLHQVPVAEHSPVPHAVWGPEHYLTKVLKNKKKHSVISFLEYM